MILQKISASIKGKKVLYLKNALHPFNPLKKNTSIHCQTFYNVGKGLRYLEEKKIKNSQLHENQRNRQIYFFSQKRSQSESKFFTSTFTFEILRNLHCLDTQNFSMKVLKESVSLLLREIVFQHFKKFLQLPNKRISLIFFGFIFSTCREGFPGISDDSLSIFAMSEDFLGNGQHSSILTEVRVRLKKIFQHSYIGASSICRYS